MAKEVTKPKLPTTTNVFLKIFLADVLIFIQEEFYNLKCTCYKDVFKRIRP